MDTLELGGYITLNERIEADVPALGGKMANSGRYREMKLRPNLTMNIPRMRPHQPRAQRPYCETGLKCEKMLF